MANGDLIIDDESCQAMANHCVQEAERLEALIERYLTCLNNANKNGLTSGSAAKAFSAYITYASKLKGQLNELSGTISDLVSSFIGAVDDADEYLF